MTFATHKHSPVVTWTATLIKNSCMANRIHRHRARATRTKNQQERVNICVRSQQTRRCERGMMGTEPPNAKRRANAYAYRHHHHKHHIQIEHIPQDRCEPIKCGWWLCAYFAILINENEYHEMFFDAVWRGPREQWQLTTHFPPTSPPPPHWNIILVTNLWTNKYEPTP